MSTQSGLNRRGFLTRISAAGGALLLGGCDQLSQSPTFRDILGKAEGATQRVQRLVLSHRSMAREFSESDLSKHFKANGSINVEDASYQTMVRDGFANWRLKIDGLVERPTSLSLDELRRLPSRTQITRHDCVEGWSAIGKWKGAQLGPLLQSVGLKPECALSGLSLRRHDEPWRALLREHRSDRCIPSADHSRLRYERADVAGSAWRTTAAACRAAARLQDGEIRDADRGRL